MTRVLQTGESERWTPAAGGNAPGSLEHQEGLHSGLIVPLVARLRILGTLSLVRGETEEPYDDDDVEFAEDIARRAAIAIDNAQLYREAEERAQAARVLASVGDGVFFVDRNGIVRTWNRAAGAATGLAIPEVVDRPAVEAIPGWAEIVARVPIVAAGQRLAARRVAAARPRRPRALALDPRRRGPRRHRLRVPRPDRGARARDDAHRVRLDGLTRAAHAARRDLRRCDDAAPQRRRARRSAAGLAARRRLGRGRPACADRERHPLGKPSRHGHAARQHPELRPARSCA